MWYKNIAGRFFGLVIKHACDRQTDGQNYDSQDRTSIAALLGKNVRIAIFWPRFDRLRRNLAWWCSLALLNVLAVKFSKIKKLPYLDNGSTDFDQIWHGDAVPPSWSRRLLKIWNFENLRWRRTPSWKIEKSPYFGCDLGWNRQKPSFGQLPFRK